MLKQIQAATGLTFAVFLTLHLLNTWVAPFGAGAYDGLQAVLRTVYQFAPFEVMFLTALLVHVISGLMRLSVEPGRPLTARARWNRYAGFFLLLVIAGHILAVRGPSWFYDVYPGFDGLAFSIAAFPGYFYPYYFLLALAGLYHGINGVAIAVPRLSAGTRLSAGLRLSGGGVSDAHSRPGRRYTLSARALSGTTLVGAVLTVLALGGFGGWYFDVGDVFKSPSAVLAMDLAKEIFGVTLTP